METEPPKKIFVTPQDLLLSAFELAVMIYESGYHPTHIIGVWRGGAPIAIAVHEALCKLGLEAQHSVIQAASYGASAQTSGSVELRGIEAVGGRLHSADKLLIVDDIFDTGLSMAAILKALTVQCGTALPRIIKTAMPYYKPARNQTQSVPDYYCYETDQWVVFPHELMGLSEAELKTQKALPEHFLKLLSS